MCDCLDYPLVLMAQDMELRIMVDRIDARLQGQGRPMVETNSVAMVHRLVARQGSRLSDSRHMLRLQSFAN
ncbi:hypothetical protein LP415_03650 [Polaromonas sp. P1(28)-8]|nr:hypothetical protein LP415_03650 [Polaromonas sp. P1(28)-8]